MASERDDQQHARTSTGELPSDGLARQFSELARSLQAEPDLDETLQAIVAAAVANVPGADFAGITLVTAKGKISTPAATAQLVEEIDRVQYDVRQGPCLTSVWDQATVRADDLRIEPRWPEFASRAAELGVRSVLAFQLFVQQEDMGALNLYSRQSNSFDSTDENIGLLFASHAAIALVGAQHEHALHAALVNRDTIGQAKGILMERYKIDAQAAFNLLLRASQDSNRKLHEIARAVASTGADPSDPVTHRW